MKLAPRGNGPYGVHPPSVPGHPPAYPHHQEHTTMAFILWILAVILVIAGIVQLVKGQTLMGIALIIVGLLVGPGGVSIFT